MPDESDKIFEESNRTRCKDVDVHRFNEIDGPAYRLMAIVASISASCSIIIGPPGTTDDCDDRTLEKITDPFPVSAIFRWFLLLSSFFSCPSDSFLLLL